MKKRKIGYAVAALCILVCIVLAVVLFNTSIFNPGRAYYDDSLVTQQVENHHSISSTLAGIDENGNIEFRFKSFAGVRTAHTFGLAEEKSLTLEWSVSLEKGEFKIVVVDITNETILEPLCNGPSGAVKYLLPPGEHAVRLVGNRATVSGQIKITI